MHTDPLTGARYPDSSDAPNISQYIQNAVNDLSSKTIPYFGSTASRDTAFSNWTGAGNSMRDGLKCYVQGTGEQTYMGGSWTTGWLSDGGWVNWTPNSPLTVGSFGCKYRIRNGWCTIMFDINYSGTYAQFFNIGSGLPGPTTSVPFAGVWYGATTAQLVIGASGNLQITQANSTQSGLQGSVSFPVG